MDQYSVLKVIGEGSFGRALLVQHENNNHKFVMKEIRLPKSSFGIHNSRQEAILLSRMKHPNIVAFKESFEADGHLYIVMEYCDGGDLLQAIKQQRGKLFPENKILHWFVELCMAVKHIHDKRVLHRDIKSKNIFLNQNGMLKLGDFGSARLLVSPKAYACTYVGTPFYVPPEIWENLPYNNKSDIWSLGCVLYELCTLKHPFQANSWKSLIRKICQGSYSPLPAQYSYELHYLIKQMFKRCPKSRPSASTILDRGSLAKHIQTCLPVEILAEVGRQSQKKSDNDVENPQRKIERDLEAEKDDKITVVNRKKWGSVPSDTVLNCLENAPILASSVAAGEDGSGGAVIKFNENRSRKQWVKESPETLLNMLENADLSLAFKTYTIYKPPAPEDPLAGPFSDEMKVPDTTDGVEEDIAVDPNRFESRSDEEDTDFEEEEEEEDQDWVSALKRMVEKQ